MNRGRPAEDLGRPGLRAQARRVREHRGDAATPAASQGVLAQAGTRSSGRAPYHYWGAQNPQDYSPDVTGKITESLVAGRAAPRRSRSSSGGRRPRPHREDVATTLMGRPGDDPRPAPRYENRSQAATTLPRPPSFNEPDISDKPSNMQERTRRADRRPDRPARSSTTRAAPARCWRSTTTCKQARPDPARHQPAQATR